jgi:hypothetical protein
MLALTLIEEGLPHPAQVLTLTRDHLRIRIHGPREPLEIAFEPAEERSRTP